ncbi:MAG: hypothetical protein ACAI38_12455 [Myxococcota bacterium]|nr:hypothetical protein [Myxococcota bacterium]
MTKNVLLFVSIAAAACSAGVPFRIDNPTDAPITVSIDGKAHTVAPHADAAVSLAPGKHSLDAPATGKLEFIVYVGRKGGLINPTLGDYVVANESYATNAQTAKGFVKLQNKIVIGGERFTGPFRLHDGLFIDEDWRYGVHDEFPESESVAGGNVFGKVFAVPDFRSFYRRRYGVPEPVEPAPAVKVRRIEPPPPLPTFEDPEVQRATATIRDQYARYIVCDDPAEQKRLQGATSAALTDYVTFIGPRMAKQSREDNERQNDFITQYGHAFGVSARVIARRTP